jgi:murein DD-endopeptidase MepM/ murein hydrolase activator NlpD
MRDERVFNISLGWLVKPKKIIIVGDKGVRHLHLTSGLQVFLICFVGFLITFCTYHILRYSKINKTIAEKNKALYDTSIVNKNLALDIRQAVENVERFNVYLMHAKVCDSHFDNIVEVRKQKPLFLLNKAILEQKDLELIKQTFYKAVENSEDLIDKRIKKLQNLLNTSQYQADTSRVFKSPAIQNGEVISQKFNELLNLESISSYLPIGFPMKNYSITSHFGARLHPVLGRVIMHNGLDLSSKRNRYVYASSPGIIQYAGYFSTYGKYIKIYHSKNIYTSYAHLDKIFVKKGEYVKRGDLIGVQGNTGRTTGPHLHYEVRLNGKAVNPIKFTYLSKLI